MTAASEKTKVGNYFVANYPPFSFWSDEHLDAVERVLAGPAPADVPLGLYVHLPFCRKRCDFCYFKVYTEKSSKEIRAYLDSVLTELAAWARAPYLAGRAPRFVYFGGGTPSYLSADQLRELFGGIREELSLDAAEEVTFECEPGTLQPPKIEALHELGVTRLSVGVENFDPAILERNNRAHRAKEIYRVYEHARKVGFQQINIDLIAGMVGESEENWRRCVRETIALRPESVTIYQMEVPYNTTLSQHAEGGAVSEVADWETKRRWVSEAFDALAAEGYRIGSAYTACLPGQRFLYRDSLWHGADLLGVGVSSFGHLGGVHLQNHSSLEPYQRAVADHGRPVARALPLREEEKLVRQFVLQMKLGELDTRWFRDTFGVDVRERFAEPLRAQERAGMLVVEGERIRATREGLMRIDTLLHDYFLEEHRNARYT